MDEEQNIKAFALAVAVYSAILMLLIIIVALIVWNKTKETEKVVVEEITLEEEPPPWDYLIQALIIVESEGNPSAIGKTNDVGILQITPIYVEEVNRIIDTPKYTLEMRKSVEYSLEMFEIYQSHHNPERDIETAIKLHNPRAGQWYTEKVMNQLNKLIQI